MPSVLGSQIHSEYAGIATQEWTEDAYVWGVCVCVCVCSRTHREKALNTVKNLDFFSICIF